MRAVRPLSPIATAPDARSASSCERTTSPRQCLLAQRPRAQPVRHRRRVWAGSGWRRMRAGLRRHGPCCALRMQRSLMGSEPRATHLVLWTLCAVSACEGNRAREDAGGGAVEDGAVEDAAANVDGAVTPDASPPDAATVADASSPPMDAQPPAIDPFGAPCAVDCAAHAFGDQAYECVELPGLAPDQAFCTVSCEDGCPAASGGAKPYCDAETGYCLIGCPFSSCPAGMECTFVGPAPICVPR